jgi:hypothetical protein
MLAYSHSSTMPQLAAVDPIAAPEYYAYQAKVRLLFFTRQIKLMLTPCLTEHTSHFNQQPFGRHAFRHCPSCIHRVSCRA